MTFSNGFYCRYGKRALDIFFCVVGLILTAPFWILIFLLVKIDSDGPIFFVQERVGRNFNLFKLYKFRTMYSDRCYNMNDVLITKGCDHRITKIGRVLRKYKLDELPQLYNVLNGDMSIVGPRPEVKKYVEIFSFDYHNILKIKPGITDYAAICFRNEESVLDQFENVEEIYIKKILPEKIKLYYQYIYNYNFFIDLSIIVKTLFRIVVK